LNVSLSFQQWILSCNWLFKPFHSKLEMPIYMKVVSLIKMDNFHKGRILSVWVNFGERGKSSGRHLWTLGGQGVWPSLWPWVGPTSVFTSQKGWIGVVSKFFEVMAQVDRDLTTVDYFDRLLGLIKNLGHHKSLPLTALLVPLATSLRPPMVRWKNPSMH
jgi:hypothetical protein